LGKTLPRTASAPQDGVNEADSERRCAIATISQAHPIMKTPSDEHICHKLKGSEPWWERRIEHLASIDRWDLIRAENLLDIRRRAALLACPHRPFRADPIKDRRIRREY
jgi:hypothetical protein